MPVAPLQDVVEAKSARRHTEARDLLHETTEDPAEISNSKSQRLRPRRNCKMPEKYKDFVIQQSRSMIANPKDEPLNIAVIRVDQTRVNTETNMKALERRQNISEVMRGQYTSAKEPVAARRSAGQLLRSNRLRLVAASRDLVIP